MWYLVYEPDNHKEVPIESPVLNTCIGTAIELIDFYLIKPEIQESDKKA